MVTRRPLYFSLALLATACADAPHADEHHADPAEMAAAFERAWIGKDAVKADDQSCNGVRVPDRSGFGKRVALTFDDGPNPATTPDVVAILRRHDVPATFFINGSRVRDEATLALVADLADDPLFLVGNHSWSHQDMTTLSAERAASEIDRTTAVMVDAGVEPTWFRFPFGSANCATAEAVRRRGYRITGWHIDSADWCFAAGGGYCRPATFRYVPDALRGDMQALVLQQTRAYEGGVVLFHDVHRNTADHLEAIILALRAEGFTFARLDDIDAFPLLNGEPPPPVPWVGEACSSEADCDFTDPRGTRGFCHPAGFCSLPCAGYCPDLAGKGSTFCVADTGVEPVTGICVLQATAANRDCADVPGTIAASVERYRGESGAPPKTAEACIPAPRE